MTYRQNGSNARREATDAIDCGNVVYGCCTGQRCKSLATHKVFLTIFSIAAILQGATETYLRLSIKQAALDYGYHPIVTDWLLATSGICMGVTVIFVCYFAEKDHRTKWLGNLVMIQAATCMFVIIPVLTHSSEEESTIVASVQNYTCSTPSEQIVAEESYSNIILGLFFVAHMGVAMGCIGFYTLGITFIDDNVDYRNSPALVGLALAAKFLGWQFGSAISLGISSTSFGWWLGWIIIGPLLLVFGGIIALFPKRLLGVTGADGRSSNRNSSNIRYLADMSMMPTIGRLVTNSVLLLNIASIVFVQLTIVNYVALEEKYLQSRFFLPTSEANGLLDEWSSRFLSTLLMPPTVAVSVLLAGLVIAKFTPKARSLAAWNIAVGLITCGLFVAFIFIDCPSSRIAGAYKGKLIKPYCSQSCYCQPDVEFNPVCPEKSLLTYYSPCHAGCTSETHLNDFTIFENCTCGIDASIPIENGKATQGACNMSECQSAWIVHQVLTVLMSGLLSSCLIGKTLISLRSVLPQDKSLALALQLLLVGIIVYIPGKLIYGAVDDKGCQYWNKQNTKCLLHETPWHGNSLNILSACLVLVAVIADILVYVYVKNLCCYGEDYDFISMPLRAMQSNTHYESMADDENDGLNNNNSNNRNNNNYRPVVQSAPRGISSIQNTQDNYGTAIDDLSDTYISYAQIDFPPSATVHRQPSESESLDFRPKIPEHTEYAQIVPKKHPPTSLNLTESNIQPMSSRNITNRQPHDGPSSNDDAKYQRAKTPETDF